jgi:hypothetical protein
VGPNDDLSVDAINTSRVSAGRKIPFRIVPRAFVRSLALFPQFRLISTPNSIPGSSTEKMQVRDESPWPVFFPS